MKLFQLSLFISCCWLFAAPPVSADVPAAPGAAATSPPASDDPSPAVDYRRTAPTSGWNAATPSPPAPATGPVPGPATLSLRLYEGARDFGPVFDAQGEALALDVTADLETCADGNTIVRGLNLGGWRYRLDASCEDFSRGTVITVTETAAGTEIRRQVGGRPAGEAPTRIRCEAATWTCRADAP